MVSLVGWEGLIQETLTEVEVLVPPCTNWFRFAASGTAKIIYFFYQTSYHNE
jgi:hypothetical protein